MMASRPRKKNLPAVGDINAAVRAKQAFLMALEGHTYQAIADACGWSSRASAYKAVQRELSHYVAPDIEQARAAELARLDAYLTVFGPKAMKGDGWSLDRCLRIGERRCKLLGLDFAPIVRPSNDQAQQMVVIEVPAEVYAAI